MNLATVRLKEHPWSTFSKSSGKSHGGMSDKNIGQADAANKTVHLRRCKVPFIGPRIDLRNASHEVEHLVKADFATNNDHHDNPAWGRKTGQKLHDCGRSHTVKPDGRSQSSLWGWTHYFSLKHLSQSSVAAAHVLLRDGRASVNYEKGSLLDKHHGGQ